MKELPLYCPNCESPRIHFKRGDGNAYCEACGFFPIYPVERDWLTVGEVADELGFSRTTVYGWLEDGLLVGHRISGSWRVKRHDLDAFIAAGRNVPEVTQKGITP